MVPIQMKLELLFRVSGKMVYVKEKVNWNWLTIVKYLNGNGKMGNQWNHDQKFHN
jgi:hypothetical protein